MPNSDFVSAFIGGGDTEDFTRRYGAQTDAAIGQLSNSNFGAMSAAQTERQVGRQLTKNFESIDSNQSFGRNAAVSSALKDDAMESYGASVGKANVSGAELDANDRAKAAQLGMQSDQLGLQINEENYQRHQEQSFGNSFVGGLMKDAIGYVAGAGMQSLVGGMAGGGKSQSGSDQTPGEQFVRRNYGFQVRQPYQRHGSATPWDQQYQ